MPGEEHRTDKIVEKTTNYSCRNAGHSAMDAEISPNAKKLKGGNTSHVEPHDGDEE